MTLTSRVFTQTTHAVAAPHVDLDVLSCLWPIYVHSVFHRNMLRKFGTTGPTRGVEIWPFPLLWLPFTTACSLYYRISRDKVVDDYFCSSLLQLYEW